jgi:hypothetical protein
LGVFFWPFKKIWCLMFGVLIALLLSSFVRQSVFSPEFSKCEVQFLNFSFKHSKVAYRLSEIFYFCITVISLLFILLFKSWSKLKNIKIFPGIIKWLNYKVYAHARSTLLFVEIKKVKGTVSVKIVEKIRVEKKGRKIDLLSFSQSFQNKIFTAPFIC